MKFIIKLGKIIKQKNTAEKIMLIIALLVVVILVLTSFTIIGWKTVLISIAINEIVEPIKELIKEVDKKEI